MDALARRAQRKAAEARAEAEAKAAKARTLQEAVAARVVAEQRARMTQQTVASLRVEREAALQALKDKSASEAQRAKVRRENTTDGRERVRSAAGLWVQGVSVTRQAQWCGSCHCFHRQAPSVSANDRKKTLDFTTRSRQLYGGESSRHLDAPPAR